MSFLKPHLIARSFFVAASLGVMTAIAGCGVDRVIAAQAKPSGLKAVLDQMDAASAKFRSAEADVRKEQFEKIVSDTTVEAGKVYFIRNGNATQMGAKFDPPNAQTFEYKNGTLTLYTASTNQLKTYSAGKNQALAQTILALGFGGSGRDLDANWKIADQGQEEMSDGSKKVAVEKLDLVSKDESVRNTYTHITIWIDLERDISLKQVAFAPSGDTDTTSYTNIRLNQPVDTKPFAIKCQGKCS